VVAADPVAAARPSAPAGPIRRRLATLFVDIAGSTSLLVHHPPEVVLGVIQCFMGLVAEVAFAHAGNVKDYEGDGALLYFDSAGDAARAALDIHAGLGQGHCETGCGGGPGILARMSLAVGDVVVGTVGPARCARLALVGPSVNIGSRLLKDIDPGEIIATDEIVDALRLDRPDLAAMFRRREHEFPVPGADGLCVSTYVLGPGGSAGRRDVKDNWRRCLARHGDGATSVFDNGLAEPVAAEGQAP
jgi:class 3 adenylate cyclase